MGRVYRAYDEVLGREVAIKTLHPRSDAGVRERFMREARAIGAIHHPHILAVHDAGTEGDTPYLVMELCSGGSLRDRIAQGPLEIDRVRELGIQIAGALAAAHAAGVLHRDIKPANVLCTATGAWKLADFGIAKLPDSRLTITGQFLGSPSYAAPESLRRGEFTPASDVYGLGATLYEALTGAPPHGEHDLASLIRKLEQPPRPLRAHRDVGPALDAAIMQMLASDPAQRPTAAQLAHLLAADRAPARPRSRGLFIGLAIALAVIAIGLIARGGATADPSPDAEVTAPAPDDDRPERRAPEERGPRPPDDPERGPPHDKGHGPRHKKHKEPRD